MASCSINLNQLQQISGCPSDMEDMLFIAASGFSGYSGAGLRSVEDLIGCEISGYSGFSGYSGSGFSGYSGFGAESGFSGFSGYSGSATSGYSGFSGAVGASGHSGFSGANVGGSGFSGYSGGSGTQGISGFSGGSGISGDNPGISGFSGRSGYDVSAENSWRVIWTSACQNPSGLTTGLTTYGQFFGQVFLGNPENKEEYMASEDCSAENLFIHTSGTQPLSGNLIVTIRKNQVDTALALTITAGGSATTWSNITDIISITAGDILTIQFKNLATATALNVISMGMSLFKV